MMKNLTTKVLIVCLILLSSCVKQESEEQKKTRHLRFFCLGTPYEVKITKKLIDEFESQNRNIKVKIEFAPIQAYQTKLLTECASGVAPDVMWLSDTFMLSLAKKGVLKELNEFIKNDKKFDITDFFPRALKYGSVGNKLYLLPRDFGGLVLFYNKDLFDNEGLKYPDKDWTWNDFLNAARKLTKDTDGDGIIDQFGFAGIEEIFVWPSFVWQNKGRLFNKDKTASLMNDNKVIDALKFCVDLVIKYKVSPLILMREQGKSAQELFISQKAAMVYSFRPSLVPILNKNKNINYDVSLLPRGKVRAAHVGISGYAIAKDSKYLKDAWELVKFLVSKKGLEQFVKGGYSTPPRKELIPVLKQSSPDINYEVFIETTKYGNTDFLFEDFSEIMGKITQNLDKAFLGKVEIKKSCLQIKDEIDTILKKRKRRRYEK